MESLGAYLREERQKQGKSLEAIAQKTRIRPAILQAIESGSEETKLPPASYLRGFLKLYSRELGLDPEEVLGRMPKQASGTIRIALPRMVNLEKPGRPLVKICLAAALLCVACLWAWSAFFGFEPADRPSPATIVSPRPVAPGAPAVSPESPAVQESAPAPPPETVTPEAVPAEEGPAAQPEVQSSVQPTPPLQQQAAGTAAPDTAPAPQGFTVKFLARGIVWLKLQADGGKTINITLPRRERYQISATRVLQARLGNPAMLDVWYNDAPVSLDGTPGLPLDVTFPDIVRQAEPRGN